MLYDYENNAIKNFEPLLKEVYRLRVALEEIINQEPCTLNGDCFYPIYDGEGNYVGENNVQPISVIGGMATTAREALCFVSHDVTVTGYHNR